MRIPTKLRLSHILCRPGFGAAIVLAVMQIGSPATGQSERPIRDVTPPGMTRAFRSDGDIAANTARQPLKAPVQFADVSIRNDGTFVSEGVHMRLFGIALPERSRICRNRDGARTVCGQRAFLTLRALLAGRLLACDYKDEGQPRQVLCLIDDKDAGLTLIEQGWADVAPAVDDRAYLAARDAARVRGIGIWADAAR